MLVTDHLSVVAPVVAYLLGSTPFGYLLVRWQRGIDVRATGSGATGATNVMRSLGLTGFAVTFVLDAGKGAAAVLLARWMAAGDARCIAVSSLAAILGHCFPVWLGFRGGKGVATGVGVFIALAPLQVALALAAFAIIFALFRYVSLASIVATATFPVLLRLTTRAPLPLFLGAAGGAAVIIAMHHANIRRLLAGTESRVGKK